MKRCSLAYLLPALIIAANALILPRLLATAQSIPENQVVTEQRAETTTERIPLPELPIGFGEEPVPVFSRALSSDEQAIWEQIDMSDFQWQEDSKIARVTVTERAFEQLSHAMVFEMSDPESILKRLPTQFPLTEGKPGEVVVDLGSVTMILGEAPLNLQMAREFARAVNDDMSWGEDAMESAVGQVIWQMYYNFSWAEPWDDNGYRATRGMTSSERSRFSYAQTRYLFEGLRPQTALLTSAPPDDAMWYDEAENLIHMPAKFELTDDELLQFYELKTMLAARALGGTDALLPQTEAIQKARAWAKAIFDMDVDALTAIPTLTDENYFMDKARNPIWRVQFGPENLLIMQQDGLNYDGAEVTISAVDGAFMSAYRDDAQPKSLEEKPTTAQKKQWRKTAWDFVQRVFLDGMEPESDQPGGEFYGRDPDESADTWSERYLGATEWVVRAPGGADYQVAVGAADGQIKSVKYWPDGCQDLG